MYSDFLIYSPSCIVPQEEHKELHYYSTLQIELAPQNTDPNVDLPCNILIHQFALLIFDQHELVLDS